MKKLTYSSPDTLRRGLTRELRRAPRRTTYYVRSGSRRFWFYWFIKGRRLAVSVRRIKAQRFQVQRDLAAEGLAAQLLLEPRTCPRCGVSFERTGRQRYCSTKCGIAWRVARFRYRRKAERRREARRAAERTELARPGVRKAVVERYGILPPD